jgi:hypothetical protein
MTGPYNPMETPVCAKALEMTVHVQITDHSMWLKHINSADLAAHLRQLAPEQEITLETDGVIGRWQRMKNGSDGRETLGIRPVGPMKTIWNNWYRTQKGRRIPLRIIQTSDEYLAASAPLFIEWLSDEDEEAFRDL